MLKNFTTKELIFIALMGALTFVIAFTAGSGITLATGIPVMSAVVNIIVQVFFWILTVLIIKKKFGVLTLLGTVYAILAIPTVLYGPPTVLKIVWGVASALIADIVLYLLSYKKIAYYVSSISWLWVLGFLELFFFSLLGVPGIAKFIKIFPILMGIGTIEAILAVFLAFIVYNKIKQKRIVKLISS